MRVGAGILIAALARFKQAARMGEMRATCPQGAAEWLFALPLHGTRARSTTCCRRGTHSDRNQKATATRWRAPVEGNLRN